MVLYALLEFRFLRVSARSFLVAKAVAVYVIPIVTALLFYGYTAAIGERILVVDITIFALAITIGQLAGYRILVGRTLSTLANVTAAIAIVALASALVLFTFVPPHLPVFLTPAGTYGIP